MASPVKMLPSLLLNDNKAGMGGLNKEKINEVIQATSAGSNYYNHQLKRQQKIDEKVAEMRLKLRSFSKDQIENAEKQMDKFLSDLENRRDLTQTIVHVDMDAFYAAVEIRDDPSLKDKPMAVGGSNMLSTSNYIARRYGVRAAMPGFIAKKLCPELVIVPLNFDKYKAVSKDVQSIFKEYDPDFSAMSLDEAYLNITSYMSRINDELSFDHQELAEKVVNEMREKIFQKTQLTASAGIAANSLLAKICSDRNKPNGQFYLSPDKESILDFISELPVRKVCGIGNQTEQLLKGLNVTTCKDFISNRGILSLLFSSVSSQWFMKVALGLGSTELRNDEPRKSMSIERTFSDNGDEAQLRGWCHEFCTELANDLKTHQLVGKTVTLKLKTSQFDVRTRSITLTKYTSDTEEIFNAAKLLLDKEFNTGTSSQLTLRLMGVRMSSLIQQSEVQAGIVNFLHGDLKKQSDNFLCPVCSKDFRSLFLLNSHLDSCLTQNASSTSEESTFPKLDKMCENSFAEFSKASTSRGTLLQYPVQQSSSCDDEVSCETVSSGLSKADKAFTCPVCHKAQFATEVDVDEHLDTCLSNETVHELRQSNLVSPPKRSNKNVEISRKRKKVCDKSMKIDNFFTKK